MRKSLILCFFITIVGLIQNISAQNYLQRFDGIPVTNGSVTSISPWNGGIDQPRYQFIDIDGDNDLDLFIYDRDTSLNFYRNEGSITNPQFRLISLRYLNLNIKNWFYFIDINHRGIIDYFTGALGQQISFYKNNGTLANPNYALQISPLKTNSDSIIFSEAVCVPTFADIDADGDYDFFTGNSVGTVSYYKNIGTPTNFNFQFNTDIFAGISIIGGADKMNTKTSTQNTDNVNQHNERDLHGASAITFQDVDGDNKLDLFWGDFFGHSVYFIKNTGTPQSFNWNLIDTNNPHPSPWFTTGFNMPGIVDIDGDGKKDFFIGVLNGTVTKDNFAYYKNNGPVNNPQFSLVTKNFIPCIDVGSNSYPTFCDIDNDSKPDLFIGCSDSRIAYYKNTGTQFNPAYTLVTDSLPILKTSFNYAPTFGDLDGDGKKDMLIGAFDGKLRYFKNTGTVQNPVFTFTASQFDAISVVQSSAPVLVALDSTGLLDLLIGDSGGHLAYYKNDGTANAFHFTLVSSTFQGIAVGNDSAPTLADIDGDGDLDLLIGNRAGKIFYYRNDGTATAPNFVLASNNYAGINVTLYCVPALVDVNSDGDKDLFVGSIKGGLFYFENRDIIGVNQVSTEIPKRFSLGQNYPNPFNPTTKISFTIPTPLNLPFQKGGTERSSGGLVFLSVYNSIGKQVATLVNQHLNAGTYDVEWNASDYPSGVYFYQLQLGDFRQSKKMILLK